jgi:hypothetical protein
LLASFFQHNIGSCNLGRDFISNNITAASYVDPRRISFCTNVGHLEPEALSPPTLAATYMDVDNRVLVDGEKPHVDTYPVGCYIVKPEVEHVLKRFLIDKGAPELIRESDIARRPDGRLLLTLFGVPHKFDSDRMIFDRRPRNQRSDFTGPIYH